MIPHPTKSTHILNGTSTRSVYCMLYELYGLPAWDRLLTMIANSLQNRSDCSYVFALSLLRPECEVAHDLLRERPTYWFLVSADMGAAMSERTLTADNTIPLWSREHQSSLW